MSDPFECPQCGNDLPEHPRHWKWDARFPGKRFCSQMCLEDARGIDDRSAGSVQREAVRRFIARCRGMTTEAAVAELLGHIEDVCDDVRREERRSFERIIHSLRCESNRLRPECEACDHESQTCQGVKNEEHTCERGRAACIDNARQPKRPACLACEPMRDPVRSAHATHTCGRDERSLHDVLPQPTGGVRLDEAAMFVQLRAQLYAREGTAFCGTCGAKPEPQPVFDPKMPCGHSWSGVVWKRRAEPGEAK
jgi:hypothetical protein